LKEQETQIQRLTRNGDDFKYDHILEEGRRNSSIFQEGW